ncbi:hypothetical protein F183_A35340 [Bryobacterales bacterium F-183]|nr:hypothetical protein F183_A35340 [Bryobacterales bacterium F-183]
MKGLLVAVGLLVVAGGAAYWTYTNEQAKEGKPAADAPPKIAEIPDSQVTQIEFRRPGQPPTIIKRTGNVTWALTSPKEMRADTDAITPLLTLLGNLTSDSLVDANNKDWKTYGLETPALELVISKKDGKTQTLQIGDEQPAGGSMYVRMAGDSKLYTLGTFNRATLDRTWKDLRDKRLLSLSADELTKLEFTAKGATVEFGKNASKEWQIVKPEQFRTDNAVVDEAAGKLLEIKVDPTVTDEEQAKTDAAFASATPVGKALLTSAKGAEQLEIRKQGDVFYARSNSIEGTAKVTADVAAVLEKSAEQYKSRRIFEFGFSEPSKIDVKRAGSIKSYGKNNEQWFLNGKKMKPETVQALIDKMRQLMAARFTAPSTATPTLEITVVTNDGKTVETVKFAGALAAKGNEPFRYDLGPDALPELEKILDAIQPATEDGKK